MFVLVLLLARGLPALLTCARLGTRRRSPPALLLATSLPFIVTATQIGLLTGRLAETTAAALVCAGLLSVLVFPAVAVSLGVADPAQVGPGASLQDPAGGLRVTLPHGGGRVGLVHRRGRELPRGRLGRAGEHPGGLAGGAAGDVLARRRDVHRPAEHGGGDLPHRPRRGAAADQEHAGGRGALRLEGVDGVGEPAEQPLDGRAGDGRRRPRRRA